MASRLTRWSFLTGLVVAGMMVSALPPAEARLGDLMEYWSSWYSGPKDPLLWAQYTTREAIFATRSRLDEAELQRAVAPLANDRRTPLVIWYGEGNARVDEAKTREAAAYWAGVSRDPSAPRVLLIATSVERSLGRPFPSIPPGLCVGTVGYVRQYYDPGPRIGAEAGGCYLATQFGPPGAWWSHWLQGAGAVEIPRPMATDTRPIRTIHWSTPSWAETFDASQTERISWWTRPSVQACASGRTDACGLALGVAVDSAKLDGDWSLGEPGRARLIARFPRALLADLGPERFRELWRSDEPLPASYARLTGRPFDEWAQNYIQHRIGRLEKESALSATGWLGWALWMTLFFLWLGARINAKETA